MGSVIGTMAKKAGAAIFVAAAAAAAGDAHAQSSGQASAAAPAEFAAQRRNDEAPDWPCIQRKVVKLTPATVWSGPAIEGLQDEWSRDDNLQELARTLASRRTSMEDAAKLISAFAAAQEASVRVHRLTLLFGATFTEIDRLRSEIMRGIERYTRNQRKLARKIDEERAASLALQQGRDASEAAKKVAQEKEEQVNWEQRVYKERENSLRYVCENPVILEQRLYQLAQEIQKHL